VVLLHLAQHLVLLLQRDPLALALLASLHHLADACRGGGRKGGAGCPEVVRRVGRGSGGATSAAVAWRRQGERGN
jgi:hypothetical protein